MQNKRFIPCLAFLLLSGSLHGATALYNLDESVTTLRATSHIAAVAKGGPAVQAGVRPGDRLDPLAQFRLGQRPIPYRINHGEKIRGLGLHVADDHRHRGVKEEDIAMANTVYVMESANLFAGFG